MELKYNIIIAAITVCSILHQVVCLDCYSCNNKVEPKCGKVWELSGTEASKYVETCVGEKVACRKLETTDVVKDTMVVTRSCWNTTSEEQQNKDFFTCTKLGLGKSCYCTGSKGGNPCNGAQKIFTHMSIIIGLLLAAFSFIF